MPDLKIQRLPEVKAITGLSRSAIYRHMEAGTFPKSVSIGQRTVGWLHEDIQKWIADRIDASTVTLVN